MKSKSKKIMVQCSTVVNKDAVRRESINGVEHIIISSYTLPDNIVMNGGLYPVNEVNQSFKTLERTLAPIEHPQDLNGNFISANDPEAIHAFHAGAFNVNVEKENGRVHIEKHINVQEALKSERGKRLLDRINELETNENPRPIHTSVGVYLGVNELDQPKTNADGKEYTWVAENMLFDHDAILLDNVGAAQPSDGVGMAVNSSGDKLEIQTFSINNDATVEDVEKPKLNNKGTNMKDLILNALKKAKIETNGLDDDALLSAYNKLNAVETPVEPVTNTENTDVAEIVANAIKPLTDKIESLEAGIVANADKDKAGYIEIIVNSDKYDGLTAEAMQPMATEILKTMASNCGSAHGIDGGLMPNSNEYKPTEMVAE